MIKKEANLALNAVIQAGATDVRIIESGTHGANNTYHVVGEYNQKRFRIKGLAGLRNWQKDHCLPIEIPQFIPNDRSLTGIRLDSRLIKVLKALADREDITYSELIDRILRTALAGESQFQQERREGHIQYLMEMYGL